MTMLGLDVAGDNQPLRLMRYAAWAALGFTYGWVEWLKVGLGKLAVVLASRGIISMGCLNDIVEGANANAFAFRLNEDNPVVAVLAPTDALVPALVRAVFASIAIVLRFAGKSHIVACAIQAIAVFVVNQYAFGFPHQKPVEVLSAFLSAYSGVSSSIPNVDWTHCVPLILACQWIVDFIHNGKQALCKWNQPCVRLGEHWKLILSSVGHMLLAQRVAVCVVSPLYNR